MVLKDLVRDLDAEEHSMCGEQQRHLEQILMIRARRVRAQMELELLVAPVAKRN